MMCKQFSLDRKIKKPGFYTLVTLDISVCSKHILKFTAFEIMSLPSDESSYFSLR